MLCDNYVNSDVPASAPSLPDLVSTNALLQTSSSHKKDTSSDEARDSSSPALVSGPRPTCSVISGVTKFFNAQTQALQHISSMYENDPIVQQEFLSCLNLMHTILMHNGKIVVCGMGKSYKIAQKLVATMNSLGIHAVSLHPSDALHGDLGVVHACDILVMITSSGNTPELLELLGHLPESLPKICLTCNPHSQLARKSQGVLSAEVPWHLNETEVYGISAPTITTTACLAVGDAVCISLAEMLVHDADQRRADFGKRHPGGAIGLSYKVSASTAWSGDSDQTDCKLTSSSCSDISNDDSPMTPPTFIIPSPPVPCQKPALN